MQRGQRISDEAATLETGLTVDENNFIKVDITANVSKRLLRRLSEIKAEIAAVVPQYRSVTGKVPLMEIESLAALDEVIFIQPKMRAKTNQSKKTLTTADLFGNSIKPFTRATAQMRRRFQAAICTLSMSLLPPMRRSAGAF